MMQKKYSLILFGDGCSTTRQITISQKLLLIISVFTLACLAGGAYLINDYQHLKTAVVDGHMLKNHLSEQQNEILNQRKQIQRFAAEINGLKAGLQGLKHFEDKIRIMADLEVENQGGIFGIGGPLPEDMNPRIPLARKHSGLIREMGDQVEQLTLASADQREGFESLLKAIGEQRNILASTPSIRPVRENGWVSCRFGYRKSPFTGNREFHKGFDIAAHKGTPIIATADGVVSFSGKKGAMGLMITINHGHGLVTKYGHCHELLLKKGTKVKRGDKIALLGKTGRTTGPHLHYEVHLNGMPVNPAKYILN